MRRDDDDEEDERFCQGGIGRQQALRRRQPMACKKSQRYHPEVGKDHRHQHDRLARRELSKGILHDARGNDDEEPQPPIAIADDGEHHA